MLPQLDLQIRMCLTDLHHFAQFLVQFSLFRL